MHKWTPLYKKPKFSLPSIRKTLERMPRHTQAIKIDLKNGFLNIPIQPTPYGIRTATKKYRWRKLLMGHSLSPYLMQRTAVDLLTAAAKIFGFSFAAYLDDWLNWDIKEKNIPKLLDFLDNAGILVNKPKSLLTPSTQFEYLGYILNTSDRTIQIHPTVRQQTIELCNSTSTRHYHFQQLAGYAAWICYNMDWPKLTIWAALNHNPKPLLWYLQHWKQP